MPEKLMGEPSMREGFMRGAVFKGVDEGIEIQTLRRPMLHGPTDVIVRVRACGLCGSDLSILAGRHPAKPPVILGHECAGEISEIGEDVTSMAVGDRVVIEPDIFCGACSFCRSGNSNLCQNQVSLGVNSDGGFANYLVAPERFVYKIPNGMSWQKAALVEPLACVLHGYQMANVKLTDTVCVYGAGAIGLLWISLLKKGGARKIISVDLAARRREVAEKVGAHVTVDPSTEDAVARVMSETGGMGATLAVEVIGKVETVENSVRSIASGGRAVVMGLCKPGSKASFDPFEVMSRQQQIIGTVTQVGAFLPAIELLSSDAIPVEKIVTHELPLEEIGRAFSLNRSGESVKTVVKTD